MPAAKYKLHVGELKPINFYPNPQPPFEPAANPVTLTGATVTMKYIVPGTGAQVSRSMTPTVVGGSGDYATYMTTAGDFTVPGVYRVQFFISYNAGATVLQSDVIDLPIGELIQLDMARPKAHSFNRSAG